MQGGNVLLVVSKADLHEFANFVIEKYKAEHEKEPDSKVSRKKAAEQLGVNLSTLYRWAKDGYLVPFNVGNKVYYWQSSIDAIINNNLNTK